MAQTVSELVAHVDRKRQQLGDDLEALEHKVERATDWRQPIRSRPLVALGIAFAGGMLLGSIRPAANGVGGGRSRRFRLEVLDHISAAFVSLAAAKVTGYISERVPEFEHHLNAVKERQT